MGLLLAVALILSYVESLIPFFFWIPGMKLGLANLAVVLTLYLYDWREALLINFCRIIIAGFLFGNLYMILYSLAGGTASFLIMLIMRHCGYFSIKGVSIGGGVAHNIGQLLVACLVVETTGIIYYLPILMIAGLVTGLLIGILAGLVMPLVYSDSNASIGRKE